MFPRNPSILAAAVLLLLGVAAMCYLVREEPLEASVGLTDAQPVEVSPASVASPDALPFATGLTGFVQLDRDGRDMESVLGVVAEITGERFLFTPAIPTFLPFSLAVPRDQIGPVLDFLLAAHDLAAIRQPEITKVVPTAVSRIGPINPRMSARDLEHVRYLYSLSDQRQGADVLEHCSLPSFVNLDSLEGSSLFYVHGPSYLVDRLVTQLDDCDWTMQAGRLSPD